MEDCIHIEYKDKNDTDVWYCKYGRHKDGNRFCMKCCRELMGGGRACEFYRAVEKYKISIPRELFEI